MTVDRLQMRALREAHTGMLPTILTGTLKAGCPPVLSTGRSFSLSTDSRYGQLFMTLRIDRRKSRRERVSALRRARFLSGMDPRTRILGFSNSSGLMRHTVSGAVRSARIGLHWRRFRALTSSSSPVISHRTRDIGITPTSKNWSMKSLKRKLAPTRRDLSPSSLSKAILPTMYVVP